MTRRSAPALLAVAFFATLLTAGCSDSPASFEPSPVGRESRADASLRTAGWALTGDRLSVLVRNDSAQTVRSARAVITARDRHGNAVATMSGSSQCCGIVQLAPGATSGLYVDLGPAGRRVTAVTVRYADIAVTVPSRSAPASSVPTVTVSDVALQTGGATTVVTARLTARGPAVAGRSVRGQAVLTDAGGRIVAVLAQSTRCLAPGRARSIRLELPARVPAGTIVGSMSTAPLDSRSC